MVWEGVLFSGVGMRWTGWIFGAVLGCGPQPPGPSEPVGDPIVEETEATDPPVVVTPPPEVPRSFDARPLDEPLALVAGRPITLGEVDRRAAVRLALMRRETFAARDKALQTLIDEAILSDAASAAGLPVDEYIEQAVTNRGRPVTTDEARAFFRSRPMGNRTFEDMKDRIVEHLERERREEVRQTWLTGARAAAQVEVLLDPPRVALSLDGLPSRGRSDAPITMVLLVDGRVDVGGRNKRDMDEIRAHYGDDLREVFLHYAPSPGRPHWPNLALECAGEQRQFWPYYDRLGGERAPAPPERLKKLAVDMGMDADVFATCLDEQRHVAKIEDQTQIAAATGVQGTPSYLVNGAQLQSLTIAAVERLR